MPCPSCPIMTNMIRIEEIKEEDKLKYKDLLLLGDEDMHMIERYLHRGVMYALFDDEARTIAVVTEEGPSTMELKNLATVPRYQGQGYGHIMVDFIKALAKKRRCTLLVGTGDNPKTIGFYESCGFTRSHFIEDFFTDNYDHVIIEDGIKLKDMVYLKLEP